MRKPKAYPDLRIFATRSAYKILFCSSFYITFLKKYMALLQSDLRRSATHCMKNYIGLCLKFQMFILQKTFEIFLLN